MSEGCLEGVLDLLYCVQGIQMPNPLKKVQLVSFCSVSYFLPVAYFRPKKAFRPKFSSGGGRIFLGSMAIFFGSDGQVMDIRKQWGWW